MRIIQSAQLKDLSMLLEHLLITKSMDTVKDMILKRISGRRLPT
jgi:hypothetical protein